MLSRLVSALLLCAAASPLPAQEAMDPLLEQRRIDALTARTSALGGFQPQGGVPDPGPAQAAEGPCFQVNRLTVEGATLLTRTELDALTAPFAPKCMQGADIQGAMRAIDAAYANKGYITTKTYIPPQNLGSGTLTLKVVEGHVEGIYLIDGNGQIEGARARRLLGTAFPLQKGRLFNLRDFEQGLDQMNRLTSVDATLRLQPGQMTGGSDILVQRMQEDRFRGALRFDTLGSRMNGRNRLALDLGLDDLLGMNDTWVLNLSSTRNTNALSLYGSVPWRYWTFEIEFGHSEYLTPLSPLSELFGSTRSAVITARYMLARGQYSTTEASFALNQRHSQRFINDSRLTPQRLASLDLGVSHIRLGQSARNSVDATVSFGLDALGADRDPAGLGRDDPRAQYVLISGGWQRQAGLRDMGTLVTDLRLQLSHQALYGSEQLALGSYATVRGYDEPVAAGDRGAYLRTDLYLSPDFWTQIVPEQIRAEVTTRMQPLLFLDVGFAHDVASSRTTRAAGIGVGVSWQFDRVTASGLVGLPLIDSRNRVHSDDPVMQIRFDVKTW